MSLIGKSATSDSRQAFFNVLKNVIFEGRGSHELSLVERDIVSRARTLSYFFDPSIFGHAAFNEYELSRKFNRACRIISLLHKHNDFKYGFGSWAMVMLAMDSSEKNFLHRYRRSFFLLRHFQIMALLICWIAKVKSAGNAEMYLERYSKDFDWFAGSALIDKSQRVIDRAKRGGTVRKERYARIKGDMQQLARSRVPPSGRWRSRRNAAHSLLSSFVAHEDFARLGMSEQQSFHTLDKFLKEMEDANALFGAKK